MALDKLALPAISDADVLDVLRSWDFKERTHVFSRGETYDCCFVPPLLTTFEPQHPPPNAPLEHVSVRYSKKHSPGTVRHLGSYNQCCWARLCYKFHSPATSCLRSVCTLARGQYAPRFHSALPIYHHHHDLRVPSVHAIFLFRNCACLHAGPTLRFVMLCT